MLYRPVSMEPPTLGRLTAYIDHDRVNISECGACQQGSADEDRGELHGKLQAIMKAEKKRKKRTMERRWHEKPTAWQARNPRSLLRYELCDACLPLIGGARDLKGCGNKQGLEDITVEGTKLRSERQRNGQYDGWTKVEKQKKLDRRRWKMPMQSEEVERCSKGQG